MDSVLNALPKERAAELKRVRDVVRKHLPKGYEEAAVKGMIVWQVPFARYRDTYNGQPLWIAALGAPKSYNTLHLMSAYGSKKHLGMLQAGFKKAGKKLDMGKACIHFHKADELALEAIGEVVAAMPVDAWVAIAQKAFGKKK